MSIMEKNQSETESEIRKMGLAPAGNYLRCFKRIDGTAKLLVLLLESAPGIVSSFFERPYLIVFTNTEIFLKEEFGKRKLQRFKKKELQAFKVVHEADQRVVFEFSSRGESHRFYAYADSAGRVSYIAENLKQLEENHWQGYFHQR